MVQSVLRDIKSQFEYGNMISRLILVNLAAFLVIVLVKAFTPGGGASEAFQTFIRYIALSGQSIDLLWRPWTLLTHMFVHEGFWHIAWNMLMLYWFGKIVGDLIGDHRIIGIYILGGIAGGVAYLLYASLAGISGIAYGASAAVMAFVVAAGYLAPEYRMHLILIGEVRLKYIVLALVLIDLVFLAEANNTGGRIAHLGGAAFGAGYVYLLRRGYDLTAFMQSFRPSSRRPAPMTVAYRQKTKETQAEKTLDERVDEILDKINTSGYESLTAEEKNILQEASKQ